MPLSWFEVFIVLAASACFSYYAFWPLFILPFLFLLAGGIWGGKYSLRSYSALALFLMAVLFFNWMQMPVPLDLRIQDGVVLTGRVETVPEFDGNRSSFVLKSKEPERAMKKIQVFCNFEAAVQKGEEISLRGDLKLPRPPGNPGEFDYPRYLSYSGIYYLMSVKEKNAIAVISAPGRSECFFAAIRNSGEKIIKDRLPAPEAAILLGMLLGKTDDMAPEQYRDFQKSGIVHIFSVSGLHVGFFLLLMACLTSLCRMSPGMKLVVTGIFLLLYASVVAWPVSVIRAVIMAIVGLLAYYSGRENALLNGLGLAGTIIIVSDPFALFKISFQLSFMATWGLLYLFPLLKKRLQYTNRLWDLLLIPLSAQLAVLPLTAYHFNLFSPVSLLSNVLTSYLSGACVILGLLALMLAAVWPWLAGIFLYPAGFFIELIMGLNSAVLKLPLAFWWVATPCFILIIVYYLGLLLLALSWSKNYRKRGFGYTGLCLILLFILLISLPASLYQQGVMELVLIDVGQGDSILLKSPGGKFVLVDGGGSHYSDPGSKKLLPYLHHRGIRKIDVIINTHPDIDHLQGLEKASKGLSVAHIALPYCFKEAEEYEELKGIAARKNIPLIFLKSGQRLSLEKGCELTVLYPEGELYYGNQYNNKSLVLNCQYGAFSFLLTGDVEKEGMQELLQQGKLGTSTVLKVPHHGSKGSLLPEFYRELNPRWAIISAGANNSFGHPHASVLKELQEQGIEVLRTDEDGAIVFQSNGRWVKIKIGAKGQSI
jgi:competence protein ComEC